MKVPKGAFSVTEPPLMAYLWWSIKYPFCFGSKSFREPAYWSSILVIGSILQKLTARESKS